MQIYSEIFDFKKCFKLSFKSSSYEYCQGELVKVELEVGDTTNFGLDPM